MTFQVGDEVAKRVGYNFPGIVRAVFTDGAGETRYVVECTELPGLLHIYAANQLELVARPDCALCGVDRCHKCETG